VESWGLLYRRRPLWRFAMILTHHADRGFMNACAAALISAPHCCCDMCRPHCKLLQGSSHPANDKNRETRSKDARKHTDPTPYGREEQLPCSPTQTTRCSWEVGVLLLGGLGNPP
jgi:hypothetical protein